MGDTANLRDIMHKHWSQGCVDPKYRVSEKSKTFSIKLQPPGQAVLLRPEQCPEWPQEGRKCDGILVCHNGKEQRMTLVLVELKGGHMEKALQQLETACGYLCARGRSSLNKHNEWKNTLGEYGLHHAKRIYGLIVGKKSLAQHQRKLSALRKKYGLKIRATTGDFTGKTVHELENFLGLIE